MQTFMARAAMAALILVIGTSALEAQNGRARRGPDRVPPGHLPPDGMCRIWLDGVPPGRQPRPTDCATARREAPRNARVVYSDGTIRSREDRRWDVRRDRDDDDDRRRDDRRDRDDDGDFKRGTVDRDRDDAVDGGDKKQDPRDDQPKRDEDVKAQRAEEMRRR